MHEADQILFVLTGDKTRRHMLEGHIGQAKQADIHQQRHIFDPQDATHAMHVTACGAAKDRIEAAKKPTECRIYHARESVLGRAMRSQQHRRKGRG